jgi:hypothetical protein
MGETHVSLEETELNFDSKISYSLVLSVLAKCVVRVTGSLTERSNIFGTHRLSSSAPTREGLPFFSPNDNVKKAFPII